MKLTVFRKELLAPDPALEQVQRRRSQETHDLSEVCARHVSFPAGVLPIEKLAPLEDIPYHGPDVRYVDGVAPEKAADGEADAVRTDHGGEELGAVHVAARVQAPGVRHHEGEDEEDTHRVAHAIGRAGVCGHHRGVAGHDQHTAKLREDVLCQRL